MATWSAAGTLFGRFTLNVTFMVLVAGLFSNVPQKTSLEPWRHICLKSFSRVLVLVSGCVHKVSEPTVAS